MILTEPSFSISRALISLLTAAAVTMPAHARWSEHSMTAQIKSANEFHTHGKASPNGNFLAGDTLGVAPYLAEFPLLAASANANNFLSNSLTTNKWSMDTGIGDIEIHNISLDNTLKSIPCPAVLIDNLTNNSLLHFFNVSALPFAVPGKNPIVGFTGTHIPDFVCVSAFSGVFSKGHP